ncbi:MAG TPA: ABC transporter permease [Myxococcales bacterium]
MEAVWQDVRLALRSLRRAPTYAFAAIAALAIAIGANTALFSLIEATLLRPYPYPNPERVLLVRESNKHFDDSSVSYPNYRDWRAQTKDVFTGLAAFRRDSLNLTGAGDPERLFVRMVGADFFDVLGAKPQIGRTFVDDDDRPGAARTVVLSNALWQRRFASDPRIVGQTITLGGLSYTVTGILPAGFRFLSASDAFVPIGLWADQFKERSDHPGISVVGRLRPQLGIRQAKAALNAVAERLEKEFPLTNTGQRVSVKTLQEDQTEGFRGALYILWGAVALVLLIAAANVANLALARAAARSGELAIRSALGAGRFRLMRELLTESVLLALAGGAAGVVLAFWGLDAVLPWVPEIIRRNGEVRVNAAVLGFTLALSIATGLLFGVLPALRASRPDLDALLRDAHATESRPRRRLRSALVVAEIALSLMLLIGAGLLMRSFAKAAAVDLGYQPQGLLVQSLTLPENRYPGSAEEIKFERQLRERISALPGVKAVSVGSTLPLFDDNSMSMFWVEGQPRPRPGEGITAMNYTATPGFLRALGAPLLRGRELTDADDLKAPTVLIDDWLARKMFGDEDPIGRRIMLPPEVVGKMPGLEVVGIYRHMVHYGPGEHDYAAGGMVMPFAAVAQFAPQWFRAMKVMVRADGDLGALSSAVRREVAAVDPELPVYDVKTMEAAVHESMSGRRFAVLLLGLFAGVALLLAAVGVYGVMSYGVVQRTREIGVRMALGAGQDAVLRLVVRDGMRLAGVGIVIGFGLAAALSRVLRGMLFGVSAYDPLSYALLTVVLAGVALLASWVPARRAARVDPAIALRAE